MNNSNQSMNVNLKFAAKGKGQAAREAAKAKKRITALKAETGISEQRLLSRMVNYAFEHDPSFDKFRANAEMAAQTTI